MLPILINIPAYNEQKRLPIHEYIEFLSNTGEGIDLQFINDGSTDDTQIILLNLKNLFPKRIFIKNLKQNVGKAEALRSAFLESQIEILKYKYVGYFDADLATPLEELYTFKWWFEKLQNKPLLIIGSRVKLLGTTNIIRDFSRHYFGRFFATLVSNMLKLPIYDTQCGAKLIHSSIANDLFQRPFISRWLFDIEIIYRIIKLFGHEKCEIIISEIPLMRWEEKGNSKITLLDLLKVPCELFKIYIRYK